MSEKGKAWLRDYSWRFWRMAEAYEDTPEWTDEFTVFRAGTQLEHHQWRLPCGYSSSTLSGLQSFVELTDGELWAAQIFKTSQTRDREAVLEQENALLRQQVVALLEQFSSTPKANAEDLDNAKEAVRVAIVETFGANAGYRIEVTLNQDTDLPASHQIGVAVDTDASTSIDDLAGKHGEFYTRVGQNLKPDVSQRVRIALSFEPSAEQ